MELIFNVHKRLKHTRTFSNTDIITLDSAILELSEAYRTFIPSPVTVKFHLLEAHVIPYIHKFCCYWPYSEEGVESAHHWMWLFLDQTGHVAGQKRKLERFTSKWLTQQHPSTRKVYTQILEKGKQMVFKKRKHSFKKNAQDLKVQF